MATTLTPVRGEEHSDMRMTRERRRTRSGESGFALLLAILSLMLLTFLGLTLAATTSTELQIATNYRWSLQAFYNAEAGIEAGKRVLQSVNWRAALPAARGTWTPPTTTPVPTTNQPVPPFSGGTRNFEMGLCDQRGFGAGYGVVLNDGLTVYENLSVVPRMGTARSLNGSFTLWVRRLVLPDQANPGQFIDSTDDELLVLTSEGVAPYANANAMAFTQANVARRLVEVTVRRQDRPGDCTGRGGQLTAGPEGNNMLRVGGCTTDDGSNVLGNLLQGRGGFLSGTGTPR
jgi:hypothetical protein